MKLTLEIRKPDGRILGTMTVKPVRGCAVYCGMLFDIFKDERGSYIIDDWPEPGDPVIPIEQSDPDLAAKIAWFVQNRKEIRELTGVRYVEFD